jgi:hypothetical protein
LRGRSFLSCASPISGRTMFICPPRCNQEATNLVRSWVDTEKKKAALWKREVGRREERAAACTTPFPSPPATACTTDRREGQPLPPPSCTTTSQREPRGPQPRAAPIPLSTCTATPNPSAEVEILSMFVVKRAPPDRPDTHIIPTTTTPTLAATVADSRFLSCSTHRRIGGGRAAAASASLFRAAPRGSRSESRQKRLVWRW